MKQLLKIKLFILAVVCTASMQAAVLKLATIAPEGSFWMNEMRASAAEIKKRTNGRVKIKLYGGGVMGSENAVMRKMRIGQLHGGTFTAGSLSSVYKDINAYALPFLFNDYAEAAYVRSKLDSVLMEGLEKGGMKGFGIATAGFGKLMAPTEFTDIDALKGEKLWVPEDDDMSFDILKGLGLSPVKLPLTDVLTGLQTKLLDVVGSSAVAAIALQWHTKVKYVYDQPLVYIYGALAIDNRFFGKLSAQDQAVVEDVLSEIYKKFDKVNLEDNEKAEAALKGMSIEFIKPAEGSMQPIIDKVEIMNLDMVKKGVVSQDLYDQVQKHLADYRAQ